MRKGWWRLLIILLGVVALAVVVVVAWPWLRQWLPHPALVKAWIGYLTVDLNIGRWGPVVILLLVGVIELVWALNLGRRSSVLENQMRRLERMHAKEVEVLNQGIAVLKEEQRTLRSELELREDLIREEKARLWVQFEDVQRASGISLGKLIVMDAPEPLPEVRGKWRQLISQLERIEMVNSVSVQREQSALQVQHRADELLRLGNACFCLGQYERSLTHFSKAIELAPNDPEALINRAVVNYALVRHQPALHDLERALKLSEHAWAYLYRGLIREQLGEEKRAQEDYARALRVDGTLVEGYYRRGLLYAKGGDYEKAYQDQNQVLQLDEHHAGAYTARGAVRAALGDAEWALSDLDRGCALAPERRDAFFQRGRVRHQLAVYDGALADFARLIELDQSFAPVFMARGDTYMALGEYWRAIDDYGQAIDLQPKNAAAYRARGLAFAALKDYPKAIKDLDRALELDPGLVAALAERGAAYEKLGEYETAIDDLDRAITLDPNLAIAYYTRGLAYGSKGEYDRASRDLNRAIELDPSLGSKERAANGGGSV